MKKLLSRLISSLLISGLAMDPAIASAIHPKVVSAAPPAAAELFAQNAINARLRHLFRQPDFDPHHQVADQMRIEAPALRYGLGPSNQVEEPGKMLNEAKLLLKEGDLHGAYRKAQQALEAYEAIDNDRLMGAKTRAIARQEADRVRSLITEIENTFRNTRLKTTAARMMKESPVGAAIAHIEMLIGSDLTEAAKVIAFKLRVRLKALPPGELTVSDPAYIQFVRVWEYLYPTAKGLVSLNIRDQWEGYLNTLINALVKKAENDSDLAIKNRLKRTAASQVTTFKLLTDVHVTFPGHSRWLHKESFRMKFKLPVEPKVEEVTSKVRRLLEVKAPKDINWFLRINGLPPRPRTLDSWQVITPADVVSVHFQEVVPHRSFQPLQTLPQAPPHGYGSGDYLPLSILEKLRDGTVLTGVSYDRLEDVWGLLRKMPLGNSLRVVGLVMNQVDFAGGPFAFRMIPGTGFSDVFTVEIAPESVMAKQVALEEQELRKLKTLMDKSLSKKLPELPAILLSVGAALGTAYLFSHPGNVQELSMISWPAFLPGIILGVISKLLPSRYRQAAENSPVEAFRLFLRAA